LRVFFSILFLFFFLPSSLIAKKLIIDNLSNPGKSVQLQNWSFITDGVMGGLSEGQAFIYSDDKIPCYKMIGNVTTENNGGFIQIRLPILPNIKVNKHNGLYLKIRGNNKKYSIHIRTSISLGYWQYYKYSFHVNDDWNEINIPFENFKKSNYSQPNRLLNQNIKTIALVAGFDNFYADICLAEIGFY